MGGLFGASPMAGDLSMALKRVMRYVEKRARLNANGIGPACARAAGLPREFLNSNVFLKIL